MGRDTPGQGLADAYDDILVVATPKQLFDQGHLVEPRVFTVRANELPDLSSVRVKQGDYDQKALAEAVDSKTLVGKPSVSTSLSLVARGLAVRVHEFGAYNAIRIKWKAANLETRKKGKAK